MRMFERAGRPGYMALGIIGAAAVTASFAVPGFGALVLTIALLAALSAPIWTDTAEGLNRVVATLLPIVYVGWLLGHALLLGVLPDGAHLVLLLVGTTWAGESAALLVGSVVGRHPLAPVISPRKTVEGAVGQLVASIIAAFVLGAWLLPQWSVGATVLTGAVLGVLGQIGDLAESVIKRSVGAKDTGGLIPGHGGVLDRLDGLLFNAPALFYCASWIGGRG
jgi:phosphatidate cytidylyltransferase